MKRVLCGILAATVVGCLSGCAGSNGNHPFEEKEYQAEGADVQAIELDVRDREVVVESTDSEKVILRYSENEKESYDIGMENGVLSMTARSDKEWTDYVGTVKPAAVDRRIHIEVPEDTLSALTVSTTNEDIEVGELFVQRADISSNGGNLAVDGLGADEMIRLSAKNGNISGSLAGGEEDYSIQTHVKKGQCNLDDRTQDGAIVLQIEENNGDVDLKFETT